ARFGSGRLTAALTTGLDSMRPWFGGYLPALILGVALPPLVVVAMAVVDPASALITVLTLPLVPVLGALIGWATRARAQARWHEDARLAGHFLDVVRGLGTLRVFGRAARQAGVVAAMTDRHRAATMRVLRVAFLSSTALDLLGTLSVGLIAVGAGLRVAAGDMPLEAALLVILLAPEAYRPLRESAARYHASAAATAVMDDLDEVLTGPAASPAAPDAPRVGATADGVRVRHPDASRDALRLNHLEVRGGSLVALRGPSGAGKTTALRVLAGLQRIDAGSVSASPPLYLPQRPVLPHARTVADVADPAALRVVGLDLPPDTPLGEHGQGVSAGQRQRLALA
ncbi:ABC transporter transmembrane domain-containing protein, partial [Actinoplanes sp. NPDC051633]|uniref:ABC transporter transmembrane domain-containing protein n=1 Tax=Actinoplanes sp. NPDC051633 TaxID=3155670 RepID=UPI003421D4AA